MTPPSIRVLIVDDQPLARMGNALVIDAADDLAVVGEAESGEQAIRLTRELRPNVILMDVRMPGIGGIEATRVITTVHPDSRVLVFTTFDLDEYAFGCLEAGASGFLLKNVPPDRLRDAVRTVSAGDAVVEPRITRHLVDHYTAVKNPEDTAERVNTTTREPPRVLSVLSPREREVFLSIGAGLSNTEIGEALHLSPATVKTHVNRIFAKLQLRDRVHAVILAYELRT